MSPEQATADKDLTHRTDIYSLGSVLYEMLTGEPPHWGGSAQGIVMKVLVDNPRPVRELRRSVPPNVADATAKALQKIPADRFETVAQFAEALADRHFRTGEMGVAQGRRSTTAERWKATGLIATGLLLVVTLFALAGWMRRDTVVPVTRDIVDLPGLADLREIALSADGSRLAYLAEGPEGVQIWVKERDEHRGDPVPGTAGAMSPTFSPDGLWLAYLLENEVRKVLVSGGASILLSDSARSPQAADLDYGVRWLDDGSIAFLNARWELARVPESNGPVERLVGLGEDSEKPYVQALSAYSGGILYTRGGGGCFRDVWAYDVSSGDTRRIVEGAAGAWYLSGHLLYGDCEGGVLAVGFDPGSMTTNGAPRPALAGVMGSVPIVAVAPESGDLLYVEGPQPTFAQRQLVWVHRDGTEEPITAGGTGEISAPKLSPDGTRAVYRERRPDGTDVWTRDLQTGRALRLTDAPGAEFRPHWSHDGQWVGFISDARSPRSLFRVRSDGLGSPELFLDIEEPVNELEWSRSGEWLVYRTGRTSDRNVHARRLSDGSTVPVANSPDAEETSGSFSPDGRWIAYVSDETGRNEVYVRPFPDVESAKYQVSVRGGSMPHWAHSGEEIFFRSGDALMVVDISTQPSFSAGTPRRLFSMEPYLIPGNLEIFNVTYDVAPDDSRFLFVTDAPPVERDASPPAVVMVRSFQEELRRGVGPEP